MFGCLNNGIQKVDRTVDFFLKKIIVFQKIYSLIKK